MDLAQGGVVADIFVDYTVLVRFSEVVHFCCALLFENCLTHDSQYCHPRGCYVAASKHLYIPILSFCFAVTSMGKSKARLTERCLGFGLAFALGCFDAALRNFFTLSLIPDIGTYL